VVFEFDCRLREIGDFAFYDSRIQVIRIPRNVEKIGKNCFYGCKSLCEVVFESESKLKEICDFLFTDSRVKMIEIPDQCEALTGCSLMGLDFVTVSKGNKSLVFKDNFLLRIKGSILIRYFGESKRVLVESFVENISKRCFSQRKSLREVIFESDSKLKEIGDRAFWYS
jgi:hypothetical protein